MDSKKIQYGLIKHKRAGTDVIMHKNKLIVLNNI